MLAMVDNFGHLRDRRQFIVWLFRLLEVYVYIRSIYVELVNNGQESLVDWVRNAFEVILVYSTKDIYLGNLIKFCLIGRVYTNSRARK